MGKTPTGPGVFTGFCGHKFCHNKEMLVDNKMIKDTPRAAEKQDIETGNRR